ncbi:MAG TPA: hypothetical protein VGJ54_03145, partial [Streptosporangiaceae bacterium]
MAEAMVRGGLRRCEVLGRPQQTPPSTARTRTVRPRQAHQGSDPARPARRQLQLPRRNGAHRRAEAPEQALRAPFEPQPGGTSRPLALGFDRQRQHHSAALPGHATSLPLVIRGIER